MSVCFQGRPRDIPLTLFVLTCRCMNPKELGGWKTPFVLFTYCYLPVKWVVPPLSFYPYGFSPQGESLFFCWKTMFSLRVNSLFFQNQTFRRCAIRVEERKNDDFLRANFLFFFQQPSCHWAMRLWRRKKGNFLRAMMLFFQKEAFRHRAMRLWRRKTQISFGRWGCFSKKRHFAAGRWGFGKRNTQISHRQIRSFSFQTSFAGRTNRSLEAKTLVDSGKCQLGAPSCCFACGRRGSIRSQLVFIGKESRSRERKQLLVEQNETTFSEVLYYSEVWVAPNGTHSRKAGAVWIL